MFQNSAPSNQQNLQIKKTSKWKFKKRAIAEIGKNPRDVAVSLGFQPLGPVFQKKEQNKPF